MLKIELPVIHPIVFYHCSWDTTQDSLLRYFSRFGEVIDCVVMKNAETGKLDKVLNQCSFL